MTQIKPTSNELAAIRRFVAEVERRAEASMLRTHKLEGAHYAAMMTLLKEMEAAAAAAVKVAECPYE